MEFNSYGIYRPINTFEYLKLYYTLHNIWIPKSSLTQIMTQYSKIVHI
jgi:hypothetical protein